MLEFNVENLRSQDALLTIAQALTVARRWAQWQEANTDEVIQRGQDVWELSRDFCNPLFGFAKRNEGEILFFAYDGDITQRNHPLLSPMAWFACVPWVLRKKTRAGTLRLIFRGADLGQGQQMERMALRLHGYARVLDILDESRDGQKKIRLAVGDGQNFPLLGWPIEEVTS